MASIDDIVTAAETRRSRRIKSREAARRKRESGEFLSDLRGGATQPDPYGPEPVAEAYGMNPVQWGASRAAEAIEGAPLPLGIGEQLGQTVRSGVMGRSTAGDVGMAAIDAVDFVPAAWGLKVPAKAAALGVKNVRRQLPKGATVRGETFSPQRREYISPDYAGENPGMLGEESGRGQIPGSYWYDTDVQAMPEGSIGVEGHRADLGRVLMPGSKQQKKLRAESVRNVRRVAEAQARRGGYAPVVDQREVAHEFERLVQENGYYGYAADLPSGRVVKYFTTADPDQATRRIVNRPTTENIARHMRDNPEGGSIYPNTGTTPIEGVAVAQRGGEQIAEGLPSQGTLASYMGAQAGRMGPDDMVGWWANDGQTYLDRSRVSPSRLGGRLAGEMNYQKAAYDIGAGEEIPMIARPLVEGYTDWRKANVAEAGGQQFGQRGAVAPAGLRRQEAQPGEPDLFGSGGAIPSPRITPSGLPAHLEEDITVLSARPDVPQMSLARKQPVRGNPPSIAWLEDPKNIKRVTALVKKGQEAGGDAWYNTSPILREYISELGEADGRQRFKEFMDRVAATSPRSTVARNIRRATYYQTRHQQGLPLDTSGKQPPAPYGHLAHKTQLPILKEIEQTGNINPFTRPKTASFSENLQGNYAPLTADAHYARGIDLRKASGKPETEAPSSTQYPGVEEFGRKIARKLKIEPAQMQANLWMGAAEETGVANPQIFMAAFNDVLANTAKSRGISQDQAMKDFINGRLPFLTVLGVAVTPALLRGEKETVDTEM